MSTPYYKRILFIFLAAVLLYFTLISGLLHFEREVSVASITHFHEAIWYSVVTLTTMGYGDLTPISVGGRVIGFIFALLSISLYILIIATFFAFVFRQIRQKRNILG